LNNKTGGVIDFDGDPVQLVKSAKESAEQEQQARQEQHQDDYKMYSGILDMAYRDPDHANIFIPKIWSIVKHKVPRDVKSLFGVRPYLPFTTKREEFTGAVRVWEDFIDDLCHHGNYKLHGMLAATIKTVYGTSFMEATPWWESVEEPVAQPGSMGFGTQTVHRLRMRFRVYAPWEIFVDPIATGLEEKGQCRYVVKVQIASRRQVLKMAEAGAYPGFDVQKFIEDSERGGGADTSDHWGYQVLEGVGLGAPHLDKDTCLIWRYESEDRYIDLLNGRYVLRDAPNPYRHGMINLSRWVHDIDAHTQNQFWGIGEVKPNEVLQEMLNDTLNLTFDSHGMMNQPMIYYRKNTMSPNALIKTAGNRVAVDVREGEPISNAFFESYGQPLPPDHYKLPEMLDQWMDRTARQYDASRGEQSQGDPTATEIVTLSQAGGESQEMAVSLSEMSFSQSIGTRIVAMATQAAGVDDLVESVGIQQVAMAFDPAMRMGLSPMMINPLDLPGQYNLDFRGSDRVVNQAVKQRNWKELGPVLQALGVAPDYIAKKLLEVYEEDNEEARDAIMRGLMMRAMEQEQQQNMEQKTDNKQQGGKSKVNTPKNVAEGSAKEVRQSQ